MPCVELESGSVPHTVSIPAAELPCGQRKVVFVAGRSVALFNVGGTVYAIDNTCPHQGASLANGKLQGAWLQCPAHGLRFDLAAKGTAGVCLTHLPLTIANDTLTITLHEGHGPP